SAVWTAHRRSWLIQPQAAVRSPGFTTLAHLAQRICLATALDRSRFKELTRRTDSEALWLTLQHLPLLSQRSTTTRWQTLPTPRLAVIRCSEFKPPCPQFP